MPVLQEFFQRTPANLLCDYSNRQDLLQFLETSGEAFPRALQQQVLDTVNGLGDGTRQQVVARAERIGDMADEADQIPSVVSEECKSPSRVPGVAVSLNLSPGAGV